MPNKEIIDYIKELLSKGVEKEEIKEKLKEVGLGESEIEELLYNASFFSLESKDNENSVNSSDYSLSSPGQIISAAWCIYKRNIGAIMVIGGITALIVFLLNFLFYKIVIPNLIFSNAEILIATKAIIGFLDFYLKILMAVSLTYLAKYQIEIKKAVKKGFNKLFSFAWVSILMGLATAVGLIFLIVPGIIFLTWFSLSTFVLVFEDKKGIKALKGSMEYVRGNGWKVFGDLLFFGFFSLIIVFAVLLLILGIGSVIKSPYMAELNGLISGIFVYPISVIYIYLIYKKLKDKHYSSTSNL